jgi:subtilisin family serine protease/DNA uptake protein ComE-like DNA-binding protein
MTMRRISHDEKLAFVCGGLSDQEIRAIREGRRTEIDFDEAATRVGLDRTTFRQILTDQKALEAVRLNPNGVNLAQLKKLPGMAPERAKTVLDGRPYYAIWELEAATGLPPTFLDDLFLIKPLHFRDKPAEKEVGLVPVPGRYIVPSPREFEEDLALSIGYTELVPATAEFSFRVVQPLDFESPTPPHVLKKVLGGDVHPVLRDPEGFERYGVPGSLDLWFKLNIPVERRSAIIEELGLEVTWAVSGIGYYKVALKSRPDDLDVIRVVLDRVEKALVFEEIRFSELDYVGFEDFEPDTVTTAGDDDFEATDRFWNHEAINLSEAHAITRGSTQIVIFIIDSGTRMDHEDLASAFRTDWQQLDLNFDLGVPEAYTSPDERSISHGTKVTGVISGQGHNDLVGVGGVAPDCRVLPVKISGKAVTPAYGLRAAAILQSLMYLQNGERAVLNLSWRTNGEHIGIREALKEAQAKGAVIVTSAGNYIPGAPQKPDDIHYPSAHMYRYPKLKSLCTVAAVGFGDRKASYSYYGAQSTTVMACGGERGGSGIGIYTTSTPEKYIYTQGTSFAAPQVAGLIALMLSMRPDMSAEEIIRIIKETADSIDDVNPAYKGMLGAGRINAGAALVRLSGTQVHIIKASADPHGTISPQGAVAVAHGADQEFVIVADPGHKISQLLIDGVPTEAQASYTFDNVSAPHTIEAHFVPDEPHGVSHYDEMGRLNINLATVAEMCTLPLVGSWRAQHVVQHREINGPFSSIWGLAQTLVFDAWIIGQLEPLITV